MFGGLARVVWVIHYSYTGVWDVMTNEEVLEFIRKRIAQKMTPAQVIY